MKTREESFQFLLAQADQGDLKEVKKHGNATRKIQNSVKLLIKHGR